MFQLLCLVCILSFKIFVMCENGSHENHLISTSRLNDLVGQLEEILQIETVNKDKISLSSSEDTPSSWTIVPPKYMIDLYHKYADDKFIWDIDPSKTTTIRCILGKVRGDSVHFNLSSLMETKSISHAEIHVFRRTRRGKSSRSKSNSAQHRIRLRNLPKKLFLSTIISFLPKRGWQAVDITNTVKTSLGKGKFLSMTVEASIPEFGSLGRERYHTIPIDEVLRLAYRPFLVIFSSDALPPRLTSSSGLPRQQDTVKSSTKKELSTSSSSSNGELFPPFEENENYGGGGGGGGSEGVNGDNVDELENSLKSILNIDKMTRIDDNNEIHNGFGIENNEISDSDSISMDHFHLHNSIGGVQPLLPSPTSFGKKIPLINQVHSMGKRSIEDNEFSEDPESPLSQSPSNQLQPDSQPHHYQQKMLQKDDENSLLNVDHTNVLLPPTPLVDDDDGQFLLRQDNLDNGFKPSSSSSSKSSKESNPNPILPFPSRHRWWNQPLDHSWTSSSSKGKNGRRRGKSTNRRKKLRRNRQGKKYWTSEKISQPPPTPATSSTPSSFSSAMDTTAKSTSRDAQLFYKESTKTRNSCRLEELSVDTANIDWAESIIAPAVLPLSYCEGPCSFSSQLTNSQTLGDSSDETMLDFNSLDVDYSTATRALQSRCCVPSVKKRLVVLFSDIHDSIILRIHPNVTATGCQFL